MEEKKQHTIISASEETENKVAQHAKAVGNAGTMRIGAKGEWPNAVLTGIGSPVFANLAFDDGALWRPEQTDEPLALTGTLSFGDAVRYAVTRPSGTGVRVFTAATAAGGIVGSPEWIRESGSRYVPEIRGNDVIFGLKGFALFLR